MRTNPHAQICGSPGGAIPQGDPAHKDPLPSRIDSLDQSGHLASGPTSHTLGAGGRNLAGPLFRRWFDDLVEHVFVLRVADQEGAFAVLAGHDELEAGHPRVDRDERDGAVVILARGDRRLASPSA